MLITMDIVRVSFTGRVKDTGAVFDTTDADIAKKAGIFNDQLSYGPTPLIIGDKRLIAGLENALAKMKPKETKAVEIAPKEGFGERDPELVKLVPLKVFKANGIEPRPGMVVVLENNLPGRIQSVSSGRVRVDFNHELAGRALEYDLKLEDKLSDDKDKVAALFEMVFTRIPAKDLKVNKTEKEVEIILPKDCTKLADLQARKITLITQIKKYAGLDKIRITEEY
jgi:FKBP-type peptidyl-prolyl cis-trans isomerase 2